MPLWAEILTAALGRAPLFVLAAPPSRRSAPSAWCALPTFFRRIHAPTLGATLGVWCMTVATIVFFSVQGDHLFLHAVLIALFVALTAPVTTIFLMRAALFRERQKGGKAPPAASED